MLHAIVVGVDVYFDPAIPNLSCAAADAAAVGQLLSERIVTEERNVRLLVDHQATRENVMAAVAEDLPDQIETGDAVLIYFAGHGSPERIGKGDRRSRYLLPHNASFFKIHTTGIDMQRDVMDWFDRLAAARLVLVVLDACFSGAAGGRSIMGPTLAAQPHLGQHLADPDPVSLRGLDLGQGAVMLCAAADDQLAREDASNGHGVFTRRLLEALKRPRGSQRAIPLTDLYGEVEQAVRRDTGGAQEPIISAIQLKRGSFPSLPIG